MFRDVIILVLDLQKSTRADGRGEEKNPAAVAPGEGVTEKPEERDSARGQQTIIHDLRELCLVKLCEDLCGWLQIVQGLLQENDSGGEQR